MCYYRLVFFLSSPLFLHSSYSANSFQSYFKRFLSFSLNICKKNKEFQFSPFPSKCQSGYRILKYVSDCNLKNYKPGPDISKMTIQMQIFRKWQTGSGSSGPNHANPDPQHWCYDKAGLPYWKAALGRASLLDM